ncbi:MAG: hypothetical protein AAGC85_02140 [Bacteroidota bacterium]
MSYRILIDDQLLAQVIDQADYYQEQFSSGAEDFEAALDHTYDVIEKAPYTGKRIKNRPEFLRIMPIRSEKGIKRYARRFPFSLVYYIEEPSKTCYIYQLWDQRSIKPIQDPPE